MSILLSKETDTGSQIIWAKTEARQKCLGFSVERKRREAEGAFSFPLTVTDKEASLDPRQLYGL